MGTVAGRKTGDADRDRGNQQVAVADPGIEVLQVHRHAQPARGRQQVSEWAIGAARTAALRAGLASPSHARSALAQVVLEFLPELLELGLTRGE